MPRFPLNFLLLLSVAACGGVPEGFQTGSSTPDPTEEAPPATLLPVAAPNTPLTQQGNFASPLRGTAQLRVQERNSENPNLFDDVSNERVLVTGTFNHNTQVASIAGGGVTIEDDGDATAFGGRSLLGYDYVIVTSEFLGLEAGNSIASDTRVTSDVIVGVATPAADMPTSGQATMSGDGVLEYSSPTGNQSQPSDVTLNANFGSRTVDLTLVPDAAGTSGVFADRFDMENMNINANGFSGGTASFVKDDVDVDVTSGGTIEISQGYFYGLSGNAPDEAGGFIRIEGDDRSVDVTFLAD